MSAMTEKSTANDTRLKGMTMKLECYASGDGALHFVYTEKGKSADKPVTLEDAENYLKTDPDAALLRLQNWRATLINGKPRLVANIKRIDANTLTIDGKAFRYKIDEDSLFWKDQRHVLDHCLTVDTDYKGEVTNVRNYSLRAQIRHFINNESALTPACTV